MKTVAIYSGSDWNDWNDASVIHLSVPNTFNIPEMYKEYKAWLAKRRRLGGWDKDSYKSFDEFLIEKGASIEADLEEFWED